jgi:hypothetical protein
VSRLLISEPPLQVLRSLAKHVGLNEAIVLQQLHFLQRGDVDAWVEKSVSEWVAVFPFWSGRTVERVFSSLREQGMAEAETVAGKPTRWRVTYDKLAEVGSVTLAEGPRHFVGGSLTKGETERKTEVPPTPRKRGKSLLAPADEAIGFSEWLGHHVEVCQRYGITRSVPKAFTDVRTKLARDFADLVGQGYELEDFKLASEGVLADDFMRAQKHTAPENVLRKSKIAKRIDEGRALRAAVDPKAGERELYGGLTKAEYFEKLNAAAQARQAGSEAA